MAALQKRKNPTSTEGGILFTLIFWDFLHQTTICINNPILNKFWTLTHAVEFIFLFVFLWKNNSYAFPKSPFMQSFSLQKLSYPDWNLCIFCETLNNKSIIVDPLIECLFPYFDHQLVLALMWIAIFVFHSALVEVRGFFPTDERMIRLSMRVHAAY